MTGMLCLSVGHSDARDVKPRQSRLELLILLSEKLHREKVDVNFAVVYVHNSDSDKDNNITDHEL